MTNKQISQVWFFLSVAMAVFTLLILTSCNRIKEVPSGEMEKFSAIEHTIDEPLDMELGSIKSLDEINSHVNNRIKYRKEPLFLDVWQTPNQTLGQGTGDCEDIAVLKMAMVQQLYPSASPRLLLLKDKLKGSYHVVLVVQGSVVMDNQYPRAYDIGGATFRSRYTPLVMIQRGVKP